MSIEEMRSVDVRTVDPETLVDIIRFIWMVRCLAKIASETSLSRLRTRTVIASGRWL